MLQSILFNKKLIENYQAHFKSVFNSLRLLKTLLKLQSLKKFYKKLPSSYTRNTGSSTKQHFAIKALNSLECLDGIQKNLIDQPYMFHQGQALINPIVALTSLIQYSDELTNTSNYLNTDWSCANNMSPEEAEDFIKKHSGEISKLDHKVIRSFLVPQDNRYIEAVESIQTLAIDCLDLAVNSNRESLAENSLLLSLSEKNEKAGGSSEFTTTAGFGGENPSSNFNFFTNPSHTQAYLN